MKKLMIAACAIACAAAAQAATVEWKSGTMYEAADSTGKFSTTAKLGATGGKSSGATGQLYYIGMSEYNYWAATLAAETTLAGQQEKMLALIDGLQGGTIGTGAVLETPQKVVKNAINITDPKAYTGMTKEDPITAYAAVIYTYNDGTTDWAIADVGKVFMEADVKSGLGSMGLNFAGDVSASGTKIQGWASVPEPTSGLLLLLGVAGLALRRRRA